MSEQINANIGSGNLDQAQAFLVENTNVMDHKCLGQTLDEVANIPIRDMPGSLRDMELAAAYLHEVDAKYLDFILELRADPGLAQMMKEFMDSVQEMEKNDAGSSKILFELVGALSHAHQERARIEGVDHD